MQAFEVFACNQLIPTVQQAGNVTPQRTFFAVCRLIRT